MTAKIPHRFLLLLALSAAAGAGLWVIAKRPPEGSREHLGPRGQDGQYAQLLNAQKAQDARLNRLEAMLGGIAEAAGVPLPAKDGRRPDGSGQNQQEQTPQEQQASLEKAMAAAEAGFNAEPVAGAWAARNEKMVTDAFSAQNLAYKNAPTPRVQETSCRSKTCRIEMVYANENDAEVGQLFLLSDIGATFGRSRPFQRLLPDGSVQLIMYATAAPPAQPPQ